MYLVPDTGNACASADITTFQVARLTFQNSHAQARAERTETGDIAFLGVPLPGSVGDASVSLPQGVADFSPGAFRESEDRNASGPRFAYGSVPVTSSAASYSVWRVFMRRLVVVVSLIAGVLLGAVSPHLQLPALAQDAPQPPIS